MKVWSPIVTVPVRLAVVVFAATVTRTVPFPLPPVELSVIQPAPLAALQAHPVAAVTATEKGPPAAAGEAAVGRIVKLQGAGAAACVTVKP